MMLFVSAGEPQVRGVRAQHEGAGAAQGPAGRGQPRPRRIQRQRHQDCLKTKFTAEL